jgi:DNA-binding IclR family transcriptional regulator
MAHHHVSAIFDSDRCSIDKLVLLSLAMRADDAGQSTTSIADIARDTGLARRTVQMHLGALIRAKLVERFWLSAQAPWTSQDLMDSAAPHSCRFKLFRTYPA